METLPLAKVGSSVLVSNEKSKFMGSNAIGSFVVAFQMCVRVCACT